VNTKSSLANQLRDKEYRDAFVASQLRIGLPMQCRALRESREWTQPQLAQVAAMSQPRISEMERSGERKPNLETLLRLASAFDVALQVRFVPFSTFVDDEDSFDYDTHYIKPFAEDMAQLERIEEQMEAVAMLRPKPQPSAIYQEFLAPNQDAKVVAHQRLVPQVSEVQENLQQKKSKLEEENIGIIRNLAS
jgi:transcriptional regulator with XRE-family HTH domain